MNKSPIPSDALVQEAVEGVTQLPELWSRFIDCVAAARHEDDLDTPEADGAGPVAALHAANAAVQQAALARHPALASDFQARISFNRAIWDRAISEITHGNSRS